MSNDKKPSEIINARAEDLLAEFMEKNQDSLSEGAVLKFINDARHVAVTEYLDSQPRFVNEPGPPATTIENCGTPAISQP